MFTTTLFTCWWQLLMTFLELGFFALLLLTSKYWTIPSLLSDLLVLNPSGRHSGSFLDDSFQTPIFFSTKAIVSLDIQSFFWTIATIILSQQLITLTIIVIDILNHQSRISITTIDIFDHQSITIAINSLITSHEPTPLLTDTASHKRLWRDQN